MEEWGGMGKMWEEGGVRRLWEDLKSENGWGEVDVRDVGVYVMDIIERSRVEIVVWEIIEEVG